jgi:2-polyprenyl-6-methoxyphenol hydroxylase-like FAD-dependent oxidoreductase
MEAHMDKKAIIIGGGIGGVTAALALQQAGFAVTVFERAEALREVGSGLPLWTNALRAICKLGLTDKITELGESIEAGHVSTWQGNVLADLRMEDIKLLKRLGTINMVVHRAELLNMLVDAVGMDNIQLGMTCTGFRQDGTQVYARFADGQEVHGDVLVGADGLHSVIRTQLFGATTPRYAGYTCWRGLAHISHKDMETSEWGNGYQHGITPMNWVWGKGHQFGITPMNHDRAYWFAQCYAPEGAQDPPHGRKQTVLKLFHDWHDPIPTVIEATAEKDILRNDVYESKPLHHWSRGRVVLLGDAAHTMTPNLGQGACQAIEDAVVLADSLKAEKEIVAGLKHYEARRVHRANNIASLAHVLGPAIQINNPLLSNARDTAMKFLPTPLFLQMMMWVIDYQP